MSLGKRILKHPLTQRILAFLLASFIRLVYFTNRRSFHYHPDALPYMQGEQNAIFAFWHGRMMMCPTICPPKRQMRVLISLHRDGILISSVIAHFNQLTISGSTSRGGKEALVEMLKCLKAGENVSITPDGPRGPAQIISPGTIAVAKLSGKPILPVTFSASRCKRFKSWDRFMLALPFGRISFCIGAPIAIAREADEAESESLRLQVEQAMNRLVEQADAL